MSSTGIGGTPGTDAVAYDVTVDPYGNSPLVAVVNLRGIDPSQVQRVQVVVAGQDGGEDFERVYSPTNLAEPMDTSDLVFPEAGYQVPVLGLYPDCASMVRVVVDQLDRDPVDFTLSIETRLSNPEEEAWVPDIQVLTAVPELMEPGWTVAEIGVESYPMPPIAFVEWTRTIAFDERGAIRWALRPDLPKGETFTLRRSITGNFLTGSLDTIIEVTKLGRILRTFQLPDHSLTHEILQIGSEDNCEGASSGRSDYYGNMLVLASRNDTSTIEDHILELDADTGEVLHDWDLAAVFDPTRKTFVDPEQWAPGAGDWLHANGLAYSRVDESIIVSGRHQGVAKIRRDGTLAWLLAPHEGWNAPQSQKLLTAVDASGSPYGEGVQLGNEAAGASSAPEFDWSFGQHSPALLPNGDLLLFDNGCSRHWGPTYDSYSRAVVYRVDEAAMTVRQIAQFIFSRNDTSFFVSNTHLLPLTGNIFIQPGGIYTQSGGVVSTSALVKEVTTQVADDGTVAFDEVVFDAALHLVADTSRWNMYSYRGHRWTF